MGGLRVNAKGKQGGFHSDTLKEGNVFLQARWLKCSELLCSIDFCSQRICRSGYWVQGGSCFLANGTHNGTHIYVK